MMDRVSGAGITIGRQASLQSLQSQIAQSTAEIASGRKSDPAREMGVGASLLYRLYDDIQQGDAIKNTTALAGERMKTMQTAMTSIGKILEDTSAQILQSDALKQQSYNTLGADTPDILASIADLLNIDFQGQKVFGGTDSAARPISNIADMPTKMKAILDAAVAANAGTALDAAAVQDVMDQIDDVFGGAGFYADYYTSASKTGDGTPNLVRIGEGQTLAYDVRGDNAAFKDAMHALALTSLLGGDNSKLTEEAKTALASRAGELMRGAQSNLTTLAGTLGTKEARLEHVSTIQERTVSAATAQINTLEGADYYTLSDRVGMLKIQLQATYSITAQLQTLSLVNYL
ncbi:flagellar hook protein [Roseomonas aerophila]|uniref:Flagellar hook protein n=1 Tax=Teichococcus aerophilus TaxID=1224513 RepID=A0ABR7RMG9_9PROT|nr:flagellin [Pseudoroseomonas aerophila]MBC9207752.1 flagellar hook protein [Pseudoroseomonas aerophila]